MFNFSDLNTNRCIGKLLRSPLHLLPKHMTVRIWQGKLRGKKWIVGSSTHGCWLGSYEADKQQLVVKTVKPGTVFFDVGAHVGFYTLLASSLVEECGKVFAFEPFPRNIEYVEKHLKLNCVHNVTLFTAAVSDYVGKARFQAGPSSSMGQLSENGGLVVDLVSLDGLFAKGAIPLPDYVKIDVEGAELSVLAGARRILTLGHPTIFLATHGAAVHSSCVSLLGSLGYTCVPLDPARQNEACDELIAQKQGNT
jgi:FkbM family methyltransferase